MIGGSGGGLGNGGEAGAGGGAIEFIVEGKATIQSGVKVAMNGGTVFVNPSIGANFSGGAGSGGAVRIVAEEIENLGFIEVRGGDASGSDRESQAQGTFVMPGGRWGWTSRFTCRRSY